MDRRGIRCETKPASSRQPEWLKVRLIRMGRIDDPRIVDISGSFNLGPAIVIESPLDGGGRYPRCMDLCNCCHACAIQREPIMRACNGIQGEEAESRNRDSRQPLCNPLLIEQQ